MINREPWLDVRINGVARTKGSLDVVNRRTGALAGDPREREWALIVAQRVRSELRSLGRPKLEAGPVFLVLEFAMPVDDVTANGAGATDLDKLARSILDALKKGGLYRDDVQVAQLNTWKRTTSPNELPGVRITARVL